MFTDTNTPVQSVNVTVDLSDGSPLPGWLEVEEGVLKGTATEEGAWEIRVFAYTNKDKCGTKEVRFWVNVVAEEITSKH